MTARKPLVLAAFGALVGACAGLAGLEEAQPEKRFSISTLELRLADAPCGSKAESELGLDNGTDAPIDYELTIPTGSAYALRRPDGIESLVARGRIEPHTKVQIPIVLTTARPGDFGTEIFVNTPGQSQIVRAIAKVTGTDIAITPSLVDFGQVRKDSPIPDQNVEVENRGNEPATIKSFTAEAASADFSIVNEGLVLGPGEKKTVPARFAMGPAGNPASASFTPVTDKPTCGPPPKLTVKGARVNLDVLVSPLTAGFGDVPCNSGPGFLESRAVTVTNYGATPVPFTVTLGGPTFTVDPMTGTVPGATGANAPGTRTLTVSRNFVGPNVGDVSEPITVTINGAVTSTPRIQATLRVFGALLEIGPAQLNGVTSGGSPFQVRNYGNAPVTVLHGVSNSTAFSVTGSSALNPGETKNPVVRLTATASGTYSTTVNTVYYSQGPLCIAPPSIGASGTK